MSRISAPRSHGLFGHVHDLYLQPSEYKANKNFDRANPIDLVRPALRSHPAQPPIPTQPVALTKDVRLIAPPKDRSVMLMTDAAMQRLWLREAQAHAVKKYVATWHREVREDREAFELAWITNEVLRREHFFHDVERILRTRNKVMAKARHLQQTIFQHIRQYTLKTGIKFHEHTLHRIKAGFDMRAKSLAWRLDDQYAETSTHGLIKVKHGGHHVEAVVGEILWQLRSKVSHQHHEWRLDNLYLPTDTHGLVRVKHSGQPMEAVTGDLARQARTLQSEQYLEARLDHTFVTLPNGGYTQVHHVPGRQLERVFAETAWPKEEHRQRQTEIWHAGKMEVTTPNGGKVHTAGIGQLPETVAAALYLPVIRQRQEEYLKDHDAHQLLKVPNGGFIHAERGHVRGQSPEALTAEVHQPKQERVTKGHADWHKSNLAGPTPNQGFAPLKGHGQPIEHVAAKASEKPKQKVIEDFDHWRKTHRFVTNAMHQMTPVNIRGYTFAKVAGDVSSHFQDLITQRFVQRRHAKDAEAKDFLSRRQANLYTATPNGGWRRLERLGESLEAVAAQVAPPSAGTDGMPVIQAKGGQETGAAKIVREELKRRARRHDFTALQRSLAAHEATVSQLQGHIAHEAPPLGATNADTLPKIIAYAPKKLGT